jgi:hypothetical protein
MPKEVKDKLLEGVPNLLENNPHIESRCDRCGSFKTTHRYDPGEDGDLQEVEECLNCGREKGRRSMPIRK